MDSIPLSFPKQQTTVLTPADLPETIAWGISMVGIHEFQAWACSLPEDILMDDRRYIEEIKSFCSEYRASAQVAA